MSSSATSSTTVAFDADGLRRGAELLRRGELVAFPTDTVYGVGAVCWDTAAVEKLYVAKLRSLDKAIPILLADPDDLARVTADLPPAAAILAQRFWPGPLTLVVPKSPRVPDAVTSSGPTVAVRIPDHDLTRALIRAAGAPLATTSANLSGGPSPVTAQEVAAQLAGRIPLILDGGACAGGAASTVVDATGAVPRILRAGPLSEAELLAVL
jgi:L-threonylcarbamoyladenylate synthase